MNGIIFIELGEFVESKLGQGAWKKLLEDTGMGFPLYVPTHDYPDEEATALIAAASKLTGTPPNELLEAFGEFIVPDLVKMFGHLIEPSWKTLDLIANTEQTIHQSLRRATPNVNPPALKCERPSPEEVTIIYTSHRKMCSLAKGIAKGVANHYHERIGIIETTCMLRGGDRCEIRVRLI